MACGGDCGCQPYFCRVDELQKLVDKMKEHCHNRNGDNGGHHSDGCCKLEKSEGGSCCNEDHEHGDVGCCNHRHEGGTITGSADVTYADSIASQLTFEQPVSSDLEHPSGAVEEDPED